MTRKDYIIIAEALFAARMDVPMNVEIGHSRSAYRAIDMAVDMVAEQLAADNARFDRDRFVKACVTGVAK